MADPIGIDFGGSGIKAAPVDLTTGECLEDPGVCIATFPVRSNDGVVQVGTAVNSSA